MPKELSSAAENSDCCPLSKVRFCRDLGVFDCLRDHFHLVGSFVITYLANPCTASVSTSSQTDLPVSLRLRKIRSEVKKMKKKKSKRRPSKSSQMEFEQLKGVFDIPSRVCPVRYIKLKVPNGGPRMPKRSLSRPTLFHHSSDRRHFFGIGRISAKQSAIGQGSRQFYLSNY